MALAVECLALVWPIGIPSLVARNPLSVRTPVSHTQQKAQKCRKMIDRKVSNPAIPSHQESSQTLRHDSSVGRHDVAPYTNAIANATAARTTPVPSTMTARFPPLLPVGVEEAAVLVLVCDADWWPSPAVLCAAETVLNGELV